MLAPTLGVAALAAPAAPFTRDTARAEIEQLKSWWCDGGRGATSVEKPSELCAQHDHTTKTREATQELREARSAWCSRKTHASASICRAHANTQQHAEMHAWWCARAESADSPFCKRRAILDKLRRLEPFENEGERARLVASLRHLPTGATSRPAPATLASQSTQHKPGMVGVNEMVRAYCKEPEHKHKLMCR